MPSLGGQTPGPHVAAAGRVEAGFPPSFLLLARCPCAVNNTQTLTWHREGRKEGETKKVKNNPAAGTALEIKTENETGREGRRQWGGKEIRQREAWKGGVEGGKGTRCFRLVLQGKSMLHRRGGTRDGEALIKSARLTPTRLS